MAARPRVLITRPGERAVPLARALEARGAEPLELEAMYLEPLPETPAIRQAWLDFDNLDRVIVVSPFAARCLAEGLDRYWPQLPLGPRFYALGAGSAEVLHRELGVRVHLPPTAAGTTSEALLALPSLANLAGQRVLLAAGEGGRPTLGDTLSQRGARVTRLALYRRVLQPPAPAMQARLRTGDFAALVVTSGELLEHLAGWCHQAALNQPLIVSSRRLATLADNLGFLRPVMAKGASPAALAAAVADVCNLNGADHDDLEKG
ncbi:uroporphyrinogen-III synthase [Modicisalibacter tunisiensis]|uniref:uroporphyrinogen-III synthase n=1 Tax=Modicisalibacter tunisiensis TaxID=390637 RepID=UPI001CC9038D|nr:uroporphyrinogen-III synthase [Modicisalibacter tunisiensis]MBZ9539911.1 uroporphyrinogen-III synthase [Modicisalibacter tunisiensis]